MALSREERIHAVQASFETDHPLCQEVRSGLYLLEQYRKQYDRTVDAGDRQRVAEAIAFNEELLLENTYIIKRDVEAAVMRHGRLDAPLD